MFKKFDGPNELGSNESSPQIKKEISLSQEELRERYEGPYRDEMAKKIRGERADLRQKDEERKKQIESFLLNGVSLKETARDMDLARVSPKVQIEEEVIRKLKQDTNLLDAEQKGRGFIDRIKYKLINDPVEVRKKTVAESLLLHEQALSLLDSEIVDINSRYLKSTQDLNTQSQLQSGGQEAVRAQEKKDLLDRTREANSLSREAIRQTFSSLERGDLDIKKLAKESNALVVHTIPLDGWSAKNTSMNNGEVDTRDMSAQEKSDIVLHKRPDLSASVISAGDLIHGQEMFYPFGYILDGKLVASYEGDEGTITDGDARRRKEQYHGTLQTNPVDNFKKIASSSAQISQGGQYNEAIVHDPQVRGVLIDENKLSGREDLGDEQKKIFLLDSQEGQESYKAFLQTASRKLIISENEGVAVSGENKGKNIAVMKWKRSAMDKAIDYANDISPGTPIYIRRSDGIYTLQGEKVTASDIYK